MTAPLFSIITPSFNAAPYIGQCIDSVLKQHVEDWELIIIDDGSTDNTSEVLSDYTADTRIKIHRKPNSGVADSRNVGLREVVGQYIIFLDSDDYLAPETLACLAKVIAKNDPDFIIFGLETFGEITEQHIPAAECLYKDLEQWAEQSGIPYNIGGNVYRSSIIKTQRLLFTPKITHAEDQEFLYKFLCVCRSFYTLPYPFYKYRIHSGSASHKERSFSYDIAKCHLMVASNLLQYVHVGQITSKAIHTRIYSLVKKYFVLLINIPRGMRHVAQQDFNLFYKQQAALQITLPKPVLFRLAKQNIMIYIYALRIYLKINSIISKR